MSRFILIKIATPAAQIRACRFRLIHAKTQRRDDSRPSFLLPFGKSLCAWHTKQIPLHLSLFLEIHLVNWNASILTNGSVSDFMASFGSDGPLIGNENDLGLLREIRSTMVDRNKTPVQPKSEKNPQDCFLILRVRTHGFHGFNLHTHINPLLRNILRYESQMLAY